MVILLFNFLSFFISTYQCDDLKNKLKKRDADLKRALQRISELESRVAYYKPPKNGKLPHYNETNRRLNLNVNVRSISLTSLESSGNEDSSTWQIEGFETAADDLCAGDNKQKSTGAPNTNGITNGPLGSPKRNKSPPAQPKKTVASASSREVIVPGISINDDIIQEPSKYTWLNPPIGWKTQPEQEEEMDSSTHSESEVQSGGSKRLLSTDGLSRSSAASSAASQSGDASDQGSMLSDASSIDSDY